MTINEALRLVGEHIAAGRTAEAEALLLRILDTLPGENNALYLLGLLRERAGRWDEAADFYAAAIAARGDIAQYHFCLGAVRLAQGRREETLAACRRAAALAPDAAAAWTLLAQGAAGTVPDAGLWRRAARVETPPALQRNGTLTMLAVYDLAKAPPTWDFSTWLVRADLERRRRGFEALKVAVRMNPLGDGFRIDNLPPPPDERRYMLDHIVRPLIALIGAQPADGCPLDGHAFDYMTRPIYDMARTGEEIPRFRASAQARALVERWCGRGYVTITLRETHYWPARNSRLDDWLRVARTLEDRGHPVIFVRDTLRAGEPLEGARTAPWASVDVDLRCALYEGAALNLGICNGPMNLAIYGTAPYLLFKQIVPGSITQNEHFLRDAIGIRPGEQLPWATPAQRWAWADDTCDAIMAAVDDFGLAGTAGGPCHGKPAW